MTLPTSKLITLSKDEKSRKQTVAISAAQERRITITDFSTSGATQSAPFQCGLHECVSLDLTPDCLRFASIQLDPHIDCMNIDIAAQVGTQLWSTLEEPGVMTTPRDFRERHLLRSSHGVAVWNRRGIVFGYKDEAGRRIAEIERGHLESLASIHCALAHLLDPRGSMTHEERVARGERLLNEVLAIERAATLPEHRILRRFISATGTDSLLKSVHGLHLQASTHQFARNVDASVEAIQGMQRKIEWVDVFLISVYSISVFNYVGENLGFAHAFVGWSIVIGSLLVSALALLKLQPWNHAPLVKSYPAKAYRRKSWIAIAQVVAPVIAILATYLTLGLLFFRE